MLGQDNYILLSATCVKGTLFPRKLKCSLSAMTRYFFFFFF